jgi:hypothetical protein
MALQIVLMPVMVSEPTFAESCRLVLLADDLSALEVIVKASSRLDGRERAVGLRAVRVPYRRREEAEKNYTKHE